MSGGFTFTLFMLMDVSPPNQRIPNFPACTWPIVLVMTRYQNCRAMRCHGHGTGGAHPALPPSLTGTSKMEVVVEDAAAWAVGLITA